ncbi:MAG: hypothetical protein HXY25_03000 [Alphaproteobacteria bacterium]|nr:hypothetical protein [Alphaproteobacteria bacterium]
MSRARLAVWGLPAILYAAFWLWYTPILGPLTSEEIDEIVESALAGGDDGAAARILRFFEEDDGRSFVMVNLLDMADSPPALPATGPGADASALLDHYMEYMYPALFARASHPVFVGRAIFESVDVVGIDGAERWDTGALMRYRSRRDLWKIASHPSFTDRHDYKIAALDKTIAFPVAPQLLPGDPRLILALALLALAGVLDALFARRRS